MDIKHCDVLVVGGGGSGLRAAISAKEANKDLNVVIATKGRLGSSGVTATACSDRMAFHATLDHTEPLSDNAWRYHANDIYYIGGEVSDYDLAEILARNSKDAFEYLERLGVPFIKKNGVADQFITDGSEFARACYTGPYTAVDIERALVKRCKQLNIEVLDFSMVAKIIVDKSRAVGAILVDMKQKDIEKAVYAITTDAIILATGGAGMIYKNNVFPAGMCGDGYALAYEAGVQLVNMEFIQFGIVSVKTKFACSGSMMRAVPRFINGEDEEFLKKYFPENTSYEEIYNTVFLKGASWPVSNEHSTKILDITVYKEKMAGHRVFLDFSKNPLGCSFDMLNDKNKARYYREMTQDLGRDRCNRSPLERLMEINMPSVHWFLDRGIDLPKGDLIEVAVSAQHFQGGVKIDRNAMTSIKGLWAVGETAGGQHGANRPGGNALLDCQVFGKIAGEKAAEYALNCNTKIQEQERFVLNTLDDYLKKLKKATMGDISAGEVREKLQNIMEKGAEVVRTQEGLENALYQLIQLESIKSFMDDRGIAYYIENTNMITVSKIVVYSALLRDESRGPHLRFKSYEDNEPIPRNNHVWNKYIVLFKKDGKMTSQIIEPVKM